MYDILRSKGIKAPQREIYIQPPANVWRHRRTIPSSLIRIAPDQTHKWALECLKAMHGLDDAPLAFQVVMQMFMTEELHGRTSAFDDCFYFWLDSPGELGAVATSYVDDNNNNASTESWLSSTFDKLSKKFGGATKQRPPMNHVGVLHEYTDRGYRMSQDEFCQKLQPITLSRQRAQQHDSPLTPHELKAFRGLLGGLCGCAKHGWT